VFEGTHSIRLALEARDLLLGGDDDPAATARRRSLVSFSEFLYAPEHSEHSHLNVSSLVQAHQPRHFLQVVEKALAREPLSVCDNLAVAGIVLQFGLRWKVVGSRVMFDWKRFGESEQLMVPSERVKVVEGLTVRRREEGQRGLVSMRGENVAHRAL
jgi:hypothetical protein